jgi:hypothetical protein
MRVERLTIDLNAREVRALRCMLRVVRDELRLKQCHAVIQRLEQALRERQPLEPPGVVFEVVEGQMIPRLRGTPDGARFFTPDQAAARQGRTADYWRKVWDSTLGAYARVLLPRADVE